MSIQMWQIIEVKKALATFCRDNAVDISDSAAIDATHRLLKIAEDGAESSAEMLMRLQQAEDTSKISDMNFQSLTS